MSLDKRIIEQTASTELYDDDFIVKDSALHGTTKMSKSSLLDVISNTLGISTINEHLEQVDDAVETLTDDKASYTMFATKWTALTTYYKDQVVIYNGELYRAKDTNVSPTFNPSAWTKISFDTLYRTTLANVKNSICEEWSTSTTYTLNDCAIHEDKLYKCVANTATVGTWVSSEWELVSIYEIIQNLPKSASDVTYDNTDSGLEADNVQDALDEVVENIGEIEENISEITETITELSNATEVTGTASGAIATFTDGADAPLKELKVAVTPYQDLSHGDPSPENICPIIGWDEAVVTRCGKNLIPSITEGVELASQTGTTKPNVDWYVTDYSRVEYGKTYYVSGTSSTTVCYYDRYKNFTRNTLSQRTITPQEGECYVRVNSLISGYAEPQIEEGNEATSFSPFGATYTIDLNGTRYGVDVDAVSGAMTITHLFEIIDQNTELRQNGDDVIVMTVPTSCQISQIPLSSQFIGVSPVSSARLSAGECALNSTFKGINFKFATAKTVEEWKAELAVNPVQMVYELATPITVRLSPTQVKSLEGTNNIFANCGDINNVEYVRNLNITINDLLSRING